MSIHPVRYMLAFLFGTALLAAADSQFPTAAFYWDRTRVAIVIGHAPDELPQNATPLPDPRIRPPYGDSYALPGISVSNGVKTGDIFDINLTGNHWVRATVQSFIYNKPEYTKWILATATINREDRERYAAAIDAKLYVFLAEPAKPRRESGTGEIRNPLVKVDLSASERKSLEANLNEMMMTKLRQALSKGQSTQDAAVLRLLHGEAKTTVDVEQIDLGPLLGVRQHILGTWSIGDSSVFTLQGWKRPGANRLESLEAIDGGPEGEAEIIAAIGDFGEEAADDFEIENVFSGARLLRHRAAYESSLIYLERMTANGREFIRSLYQ